MRIVFKTNLDEPQRDLLELNAWNLQTPHIAIPRVGERVLFPFKKGGRDFGYELEIVAITYAYENGRVDVELHVPSYQRTMSVRDWTDWFRAHRHGAALPIGEPKDSGNA